MNSYDQKKTKNNKTEKIGTILFVSVLFAYLCTGLFPSSTTSYYSLTKFPEEDKVYLKKEKINNEDYYTFIFNEDKYGYEIKSIKRSYVSIHNQKEDKPTLEIYTTRERANSPNENKEYHIYINKKYISEGDK